MQISCGFPLTPTATVTLKNAADQVVTACEYGTGPIDAMCKAVNKIVQVDNDLTEFAVQSVTRGIDALGEVTIRVTDPYGRHLHGPRRRWRHRGVVHEGVPERPQPPAQRQAGERG
ncbi:MAG: alpha-isopropylmalate synthase regulatory domain-containing protein [Gordonibacter pamelaeae]